MLHRLSIGLASLLTLSAVLAGISASQASNTSVELNSTPVKDQSEGGEVVFGHIPAESAQVAIVAENARVKVIRVKDLSEITVSSNCPHNWNLQGTLVRQAGFSKPRGGVSMLADALGSRAIVNGKIYALPTGPIKGLSLGKDGVSCGGEKLDPIAGTDMPGTCDGPDMVEVKVPETYTGDLNLGCGDKSEIDLQSWTGGRVQLVLMGDSRLSAGKLKSLTKAVVDMHGSGKAEIGDLSTKVLVVNVSGSGSLSIASGTADISNATVSGNGKMSLKGKFDHLKKAIEGTGTIDVNK
jgi:hypothetical protein